MAVIVWLHVKLVTLWSLGICQRPLLVPCPLNAYRCGPDRLADVPLMRALQAEKRRRTCASYPGKGPRLSAPTCPGHSERDATVRNEPSHAEALGRAASLRYGAYGLGHAYP